MCLELNLAENWGSYVDCKFRSRKCLSSIWTIHGELGEIELIFGFSVGRRFEWYRFGGFLELFVAVAPRGLSEKTTGAIAPSSVYPRVCVMWIPCVMLRGWLIGWKRLTRPRVMFDSWLCMLTILMKRGVSCIQMWTVDLDSAPDRAVDVFSGFNLNIFVSLHFHVILQLFSFFWLIHK